MCQTQDTIFSSKNVHKKKIQSLKGLLKLIWCLEAARLRTWGTIFFLSKHILISLAIFQLKQFTDQGPAEPVVLSLYLQPFMNFSPMNLCPLKQISVFSKHLRKSNKNYVIKKLRHYFPTANYIYIKSMEGQKRTADPNTFNLLKQTTYLNYKKDLLT